VTPTAAEKAFHHGRAKDDQRRLASKFKPLLTAREERDDSWRSPLAAKFERWCK